MAGSFPPSSRTAGRRWGAQPASTDRPAATPPVNETMSIPGWATRATPSSGDGPLTVFSTPGGQSVGDGRGQQQHGTGTGGRGLHHDRVAGQEGGQDLVAHHRRRPVEGQDGGNHAVGHPFDHRVALGAWLQ